VSDSAAQPDRSDADLAVLLVTEAVALAARMREGSDLDVRSKTSVSDVVTAADHAAEALVVETLRRERPEDGLLGEEGTDEVGTSGRRWVIDPVDGTYNFASGSDYWCSAVALLDGDDLVLGAVAHARDGVLVGGPGLPTTWNGEPVGPVRDADVATLGAATYLHPATVRDEHVRAPFLRAAALPATLRMHGSGSMDLVGVVTGRLGAWFQHSTPAWDWLPGAALVRGAGGVAEQVEVEGLRWSVAGGASAVAALTDALEARG
jgi:fructose-1,6-bisphosphatase/inositol monophosphatase family enzyme